MSSGYADLTIVHDGRQVYRGRLFDAVENAWAKVDQKVAVKNTTTAWTMPAFKGRGPLLVVSRTKPNGDGSVTVKLNSTEAANVALNIKPCLLLTQAPTTLNLINASTTTDEDIEIYALTKSDLT